MKLRKFLVLPLIALTCTSCKVFDLLFKRDPFEEEQSQEHETPSNTGNPEQERINPESGEGYSLINPEEFNYGLKDVWATAGGNVNNSTGDLKTLVIPVDFKDSSRSWTDYSLDKLNKVFFGKAEDTSWQSVSSYYETSSYGKVTISGEVAPVLMIDKTIKEAANNIIGGSKSPDQLVVTNFEKDSKYDELRKEYDTDNDGNIDSICFIYNAPINSSDGYWAWVYWNGGVKNVEMPTVDTYMWASMDFVDGSGSGYGSYGIDGHVFIHEFGHTFGLSDYYSSDDNVVDASGSVEMHSNNIGDENIYSKFLLGWANPYYVKTDSSVTLTLRSSAYYGDAILINNSWNGTGFDEYLMIEFYTPDQLNEKDAISYYKNKKMYRFPGVRMYHIDSRLVKFDSFFKASAFETPSSLEELNSGTYLIGPSNNPSSAYLPSGTSNKVRQVQLIDAKDRYYFCNQEVGNKYDGWADDDSLFKEGDTYVPSNTFFPNFGRFNNGEQVGYKIKIDSIERYNATITIEKI